MAETAVARIQLNGDHAQADLLELGNWLMRQDELRGLVEFQQSDLSEGQMGAITDVLIVALGAGGVGTVVANAISAWVRYHRPSAEIEVKKSNGRSVKISTRNNPKIDEIRELLKQALHDDID